MDNKETDVSSHSDEEYAPFLKKTKGKPGRGQGRNTGRGSKGPSNRRIRQQKNKKRQGIKAKTLVVAQPQVVWLKMIEVMTILTKIMFFPSFPHLVDQVCIFLTLF